MIPDFVGRLFVFALVAALFMVALPTTEANSNNEVVDETIYVNPTHPQASDTNSGTEVEPKSSLNSALTLAFDYQKQGRSSKVLIAPGIYREQLIFAPGANNGVHVTIEAMIPGTVTITGSDIWTGWKPHQDGVRYSNTWPYDWGFAANPWENYQIKVTMEPIVLRREMIFINGLLLRQVLSESEITEGTFFIAEDTDTVVIWPYRETDMADAVVEVGVREYLARFSDVYNLTIRGIRFQHAAGSTSNAVSIIGCGNVTVEDSQFVWNGWSALVFRDCENVIVRRTVNNHNGERGIGATRILNLLVEDVTASYNNWRGTWGNWIDWDAGNKFLRIHNGTFRRFYAVGNEAIGLWLDYDNKNIILEESYLCDNLLAGLFIEASQGPVDVRNNTICNNRKYLNYPFGANSGIWSTTSEQVSIRNNLIYGNADAQIHLGTANIRQVDDWQTGEIANLHYKNWNIQNNIIVGTHASQVVLDMPKLDRAANMLYNFNTWYNPYNASTFLVDDIASDFASWRESNAPDSVSQYADPQIPAITYAINTANRSGLYGRYFTDPNFSAGEFMRQHVNIDFDWSNGPVVDTSVTDNFSVRWTGNIKPPMSGTYTFFVETTDTARLWLNDVLVVDSGEQDDDSEKVYVGTAFLQANIPYTLTAEYVERHGDALMRVAWSHPGVPQQIIAPRYFTNETATLPSPDVTMVLPDNINHNTVGLIADYHFNEGAGTTIHDTSGYGQPLDLHIDNVDGVQWENEGLKVIVPVTIMANNAAAKLTEAIRATNEFSLELWLTPANPNLLGPPQIVSLSSDPYHQNFTLEQGDAQMQIADIYRTTMRTTSGVLDAGQILNSANGAVVNDLTHLVYTRNADGRTRLYINGTLVNQTMQNGSLINWDETYPLILANDSTANRPWFGTFHQLSIFNVALDEQEVTERFVDRFP